MTDAIPYPLDYQLTLRRVIDERLKTAHSIGAMAEIARMEQARSRRYGRDVGACSACGATIPYFQILGDPAMQRCQSCSAS